MIAESETLSLAWFFNEIELLGFHAVVLVKTVPLMYQLLMKD